ncbi:hypothetical protein GGR55DRAFT_371 [Xylaria sp. FL0064]|nr:hypothetical protein GGR55DRAFT_371 [Xylaria sp. FL0064]
MLFWGLMPAASSRLGIAIQLSIVPVAPLHPQFIPPCHSQITVPALCSLPSALCLVPSAFCSPFIRLATNCLQCVFHIVQVSLTIRFCSLSVQTHSGTHHGMRESHQQDPSVLCRVP